MSNSITTITDEQVKNDGLRAIKEVFFAGGTRLHLANKYDKFYSNIVWDRLVNFVDSNEITLKCLRQPQSLLIGDCYISGSSFASNNDCILINKVVDIKEQKSEDGSKVLGYIVYTTSSNCSFDKTAARYYSVDHANADKFVLVLDSAVSNGVLLERAKRKLFVLELFFNDLVNVDTTGFTDDELFCHKIKRDGVQEEFFLFKQFIKNQCKCN